MDWSGIVVGSDPCGLPAVAARADLIEVASSTAPLVFLSPGLPPAVREAARYRWPNSWLIPIIGAGEHMDDRVVLDVLGPSGRGVLIVGGQGRILCENAVVAELVDQGLPLTGLDPASVVATAPQDPPLEPDLGNRLQQLGGACPLALRAWRLGEGPDCQLVVELSDVSEEVRARASLERSQAWHRTLVENAQDAVAILDASGVVRFHSPGSMVHLGLAKGDLVGARFRPPFAEDRQQVAAAFERVRDRPGGTERVVFRVRQPDGSLRWVESLISNRLLDPAVQGLVVNTRDVTQRRQLQGRLREAERMRVAELLASTVAHDLNNMIGVVLVGLEQLHDGVEQDARLVQQVESLRGTMERASELARRLSAFGSPRSSQARRLDLGGAVRELEPLLKAVTRHGQELVVDVAEGSHPVRVDRSHLEQAVVNLVVNARDALAPGGSVRVSVERRPGGQPPQVALVVQDDGTGMSEEVRSNAAQPWFTTKGPGAGTGLGLVVVQSLAEDAGGSVTIDSEPGRGTRVEILLPIDLDAMESIGPGYPASP